MKVASLILVITFSFLGLAFAFVVGYNSQAGLTSCLRVLCVCGAGSTGGLVGYQYEEAKTCGYKDDNGTEHWVTSSRNMLVEMLSGENDFGVGGIIGYDRSSEDIAYLKNYAHVKNFVNMNVKAGGVIGTLEQHANPIVSVYKCENYGKVEAMF